MFAIRFSLMKDKKWPKFACVHPVRTLCNKLLVIERAKNQGVEGEEERNFLVVIV